MPLFADLPRARILDPSLLTSGRVLVTRHLGSGQLVVLSPHSSPDSSEAPGSLPALIRDMAAP